MDAAGEVCIINIGPRQRRRRQRWGIGAFVLSGFLAAYLITAGVPRAVRLILVLPFWVGALGVFQARGKT